MGKTKLSMVRAAVLLAGAVFFGSPRAVMAADSDDGAGLAPKLSAEGTNAQQTLRVFLQVQEQLHSAQLAIERTREEAEAAAKRNAEAMTARLQLIEQSLNLQRERELDAMKSSNRFTLVVGAAFGGLGVLTMLLTVLFLSRALKRSAEMGALFAGPFAHGPATGRLAVGDLSAPEPSGPRLLGAIERLEKRIHELESATVVPRPTIAPPANGHHQNGGVEWPVPPTSAAETVRETKQERLTLVLGKGQTLLNLDHAEGALGCFDEALALDPNHAEAHLKKGTTLERLKRLEEALACYDRALSANPSLTLAYLQKGGVCNQLERFDEALECYEKALRPDPKGAAVVA